jgi:hypothetical protein
LTKRKCQADLGDRISVGVNIYAWGRVRGLTAHQTLESKQISRHDREKSLKAHIGLTFEMDLEIGQASEL